jgi:hypothetical protein
MVGIESTIQVGVILLMGLALTAGLVILGLVWVPYLRAKNTENKHYRLLLWRTVCGVSLNSTRDPYKVMCPKCVAGAHFDPLPLLGVVLPHDET